MNELVDEFRRVMKGFDVYLEQSPNPRELKIHIAAALNLNGEIHRLAALEEAAKECDRHWGVRDIAHSIRALKGGKG